MKTNYVRSLAPAKPNIALIVLSILAILFALSAGFLSQMGILIIPFLGAILAALYLIDPTPKHSLSISLSVLLIAVDAVINLYVSFNVLVSVIIALAVAHWFRVGGTKSFYALILTLLLSVVTVAYVFLAEFYTQGSFDMSAASESIKNMLASTRESLAELFGSLVTTDKTGATVPIFDAELVGEMLDYYFAALPSVVAVIGFFLVGVCFKVFCAIALKCGADLDRLASLSFRTPSVFAYFYAILALLQIFDLGGDVVSVAFMNLYNIFLAVYAYVGYRFVAYLLNRKIGRPILSCVLVILLACMLGSFSMQLLSVAGTLETIAIARYEARKNENNSDNGGSD